MEHDLFGSQQGHSRDESTTTSALHVDASGTSEHALDTLRAAQNGDPVEGQVAARPAPAPLSDRPTHVKGCSRPEPPADAEVCPECACLLKVRHHATCSRPPLKRGTQCCPECARFQLKNVARLGSGLYSDQLWEQGEARRDARLRELLREFGYDGPESAPPSLVVVGLRLAGDDVLSDMSFQRALLTEDGRPRRRALDGYLNLGERFGRNVDRFIAKVAAVRALERPKASEYAELTTDELEQRVLEEFGDLARELVTDDEVIDLIFSRVGLERQVLDVIVSDPARRAALLSRLLLNEGGV